MKNVRDIISHRGLYDYDVSTVKQMGHIIKVANLKATRAPGLVIDKKYVAKGTSNDSKLDNNIARAKIKVKEYVLCNPWDYFATFTINPDKYDRYNLKAYYNDFSRFLLNYNRYCTPEEKVKYIFVPEMHKNGAWHIHGFLKGIRQQDLYINEHSYLSWSTYEEKFGYISFGRIRDIERSSNYILKYITKGRSKNITELGGHLYYASKGLQTATLLYRGKLRLHCDWDYETPDGYCRLRYFDERKENPDDT